MDGWMGGDTDSSMDGRVDAYLNFIINHIILDFYLNSDADAVLLHF